MYTLRPVHEDDGELLYRVYASTRTEELSAVPWSDAQKEEFLRSQFAAQDTHYRTLYFDALLEVIVVGGHDAGRLYVARWPQEIRIMDVVLLPAFRGNGIGERILRDLAAEADRDGKLLSIHVEMDNPARRLYERVGFTAVEAAEPSIYVLMERPAVR